MHTVFSYRQYIHILFEENLKWKDLVNCMTVKPHMSRDMTKLTKWLCGAQRRLRSAWASAQSDQSLRCPHSAWASAQSDSLSAFSLGIRPVWSESSLSTYGQRRLWSDWADAQADLSLRWAHSHIVGFVMSRLKYSMDIQEKRYIKTVFSLLIKYLACICIGHGRL